MKSPIFLLSFFTRYWRLIVIFVALVMAGHYDAITYFVGPIFYLLELAVGAIVAALFIKHLFLRGSIDAYTQEPPGEDSFFVRDFKALPAAQKVWATVCLLIALFLGCAWIASSIAK